MPQVIPFVLSSIGYTAAALVGASITYTASLAIGGALLIAGTFAAKKVMDLFEVEMPKMDTDRSRQATVKGTTEPYKIVYGQTLVSGPIAFVGVAGTENEDLYYAIALAGHEVEDITDIHFDNVVISDSDIAATTSNAATTGAVGGSGIFSPKESVTIVQINKHLGTADQAADSLLTNAFTSGGTWSSNHRGRGIAYIVTKWKLNEDSSETWDKYTPTNVMGLVKGRKVYDPRKDSTSSAYDSGLGVSTHRWPDPSTWQYSDNPALCLADYLTSVEFSDAGDFITDQEYRIESVGTTDFTAIGAPSNTVGVRFTATGAGSGTGKASRPFFGVGIKQSKIDWDSVATAADGCDVTVNVPNSGTEKRFTCNGVIFGTDNHRTNINKILSSMNGNLSYINGKYVMRAGIYENPVIDLNEDDLIDGLTIKTSLERGDRFNTVKGVFIDPASNYKSTEFPKVQLADAVERDNDEILEKEIALNMTNSSYMAQRISNKLIQLSDQQKVVTFPANMSAARVAVGDRVRVTLSELSWSNKVFQCVGWTFSEEGGVNLTLREDSSTSYADPAVGDYSTVSSTGNITDGFRGIPSPSGLTVATGEGKVFLNWVNPGNPKDYETIYVYAAPESSTTGQADFADAVKIGETDGSQFVHDSSNSADSIAIGDKRFYWVRAIRYKGTSNEARSNLEPNADPNTTKYVTVVATAVDWGNVADPTIGIDLTSDTISIVYDAETTQTGQGIATSGIGAGVEVSSGGITMANGGAIKGGQTAYDTGTGFFLGYDSAYKFSIGNSNSEKLTFDGSNLSVTGDINATSGLFEGSIEIGSGNNIFKADTAGIYLGNATFGSAPFRVTPAGALTATSATITGAITATSGSIANSVTIGGTAASTVASNASDGKQVSDQTSLLPRADDSEWVVGDYTSKMGIWVENGSDENEVVLAAGPHGDIVKVWKATSTDGSGPDGGFFNTSSDAFPIDGDTIYRVSMFVKQTNTNGTLYFGAYNYNSSNTNINLYESDGTGGTTNKYWFSADLPTQGDWYLLVAYINPSDTNISGGKGGIYKVSTGEKTNNFGDWRFSGAGSEDVATKFAVRTYQYYAGTTPTAVMEWAHPRVDRMDRRAPSIAELLRGWTDLATPIEEGVTITGGGITMSSGGSIKGGQTGYDNGTGFFLGYDSAYKFSIGNSGGNKLTFDGSNLLVTGSITATSLDVSSATVTGTISADNIDIDGVTLDTDGSGNLIIKSGGVNTTQIANNAVDINKIADTLQSTNYSDTAGSEAGWKLTTDGTFIGQDGTFRGTVNATSGTFTGNVSTDAQFIAGSNASTVTLDGRAGASYSIFAGADTSSNASFRVGSDGVVEATRFIVRDDANGQILIDTSNTDNPFSGVVYTSVSQGSGASVETVAGTLDNDTDEITIVTTGAETFTITTKVAIDDNDGATNNISGASTTSTSDAQNQLIGADLKVEYYLKQGADAYEVADTEVIEFTAGTPLTNQIKVYGVDRGAGYGGSLTRYYAVIQGGGAAEVATYYSTTSNANRARTYAVSTGSISIDAAGTHKIKIVARLVDSGLDTTLTTATTPKLVDGNASGTYGGSGIVLGNESVPDQSSLQDFRRLYEMTSSSGFVADAADDTFSIGGGSTILTSGGTISGSLVVTGDLSVLGDTTTLTTSELAIEDKNITLNFSTGDSSATADGAGITIQDAVNSTTDATILWDGTNDEFDFSHPIKVAGSVGVTNIVTNKVVKFNGTILDDSNITDTGSAITLGSNTTVSGTISSGAIAATKSTTHTTGTISYTHAALDLYNSLEADTDEKGSILTFSDNYYGGGNYIKTTRAAIKGGTDTTGNTANGFLAFYTDSGTANSAEERMRINYQGRVSIGSTSSLEPLYVNGNIRADGAYKVGGSTVIDSSINVYNVETLNVNNSSALSGTQVYINKKDANTNLMRWGEGTSGQSTYRFRIDQNFDFIANSGLGDNFKLHSATGNLTGVGTISSGAITSTGDSAFGKIAVGTDNDNAWSTLWVERDGINLATDWSYEDASNPAHLTLAGANAHVRMLMGTMDVSPYGVYIQGTYDNTPDNSGTGNSGTEPLHLNPMGGSVSIGSYAAANYTLDVTGDLGVSSNATVSGNVGAASGHVSGKFAVKSSSVHGTYDLYNNGTTYFNGATIIDDVLDITGTNASLKMAGTEVIDKNRILKNILRADFGNFTVTGTSTTEHSYIRNTMLSHAVEGDHVTHPYFFNDLANFEARGGTVTVAGLDFTPSFTNVFKANPSFASWADTNYTGSTMTITLTSMPKTLSYTGFIGISFGNTSWMPESCKIEISTDGGTNWTTRLDNSSAQVSYFTTTGAGSTAVNAIRFTLGQSNGSAIRLTNIWAYNYNSNGMEDYFLSKGGGTVYGDISTSGTLTTSGRITVDQPSSNTNNELLVLEANDVYADAIFADNAGSLRIRNDSGSLKIYTGGAASSQTASGASQALELTATASYFTGKVSVNGSALTSGYEFQVNGDAYITGSTKSNGLTSSSLVGYSSGSFTSAYVNQDVRDFGTDGAALHKFNQSGSGYRPYYERWYDGDSYHNIGVSGNTFQMDSPLSVSGGAITSSGTGAALVVSTANTTVNTAHAAFRRGSGGEAFIDAPGHVVVNIDTNNDNTDRYFGISANAAYTSPVFKVYEDGYVEAKAVQITAAASDQTQSPDSGSIPSTSGAEVLRIVGGYTDGRYTHELTKVDRVGNLPLYLRESRGTANSFTNIVRFGSHSVIGGGTYQSDTVHVFGDLGATGKIRATAQLEAATYIQAGTNIGVANTSSTAKYGISLYGGPVTDPTYGIMFTGTPGAGTHGDVTGNWATYFNMNNSAGRGWIFRDVSTPTTVASISNTGYATFDNSVTADNFVAKPANTIGYGTVRISHPGGAERYSRAGVETGAIKITLPQSWTSTMMWMTIEIYDYSENESFTVRCGGYNYASTSNWVNTTATIIGSGQKDRNFAVRFGHDGTKCCIYIGETTTQWTYPQIAVTNFIAGFANAHESSWRNGWDISIVTSFGTVSKTITDTDISENSRRLVVGGTTVIDSSRNLTNIGTISSGAITSSGTIHTTAGNFRNGNYSAGGYETNLGANALTFKRDGTSYIDQAGTGGLAFRFGTSYTTALTLTSTGGTFPGEVTAKSGVITDTSSSGRGIYRNSRGYDLRIGGGTDSTTGAYLSISGDQRGGASSAYNGRLEYWTGGNDAADAASVLGDHVWYAGYNGGSTHLMTLDSVTGDLNLKIGDYLINGTSVINSSRNATFVGVEGLRMGVNNTSSTTKYGIALYGGYGSGTNPTYGIMFTGTAGSGTHGAVTADWATYFTMNSTSGRGWIFRQNSTPTNVASISNAGAAAFNGNITAYASDSRLKTGIKRIERPLEKLQQIRGVEFDWIDGVEEIGFTPSTKHETGVIAQEIQAVIPDAVVPAPFNSDYLTVHKDKIVPLLIEAIKEQQEQIDELKALIKEIKNGDN